MRIGLDFDNTIVCYDEAIARLAEEMLELPNELPRTKVALRNFLRTTGSEQEWTAFQGALYGPGMQYARSFDGAISTIHDLASEGHELLIISHRSRWPYAGPPHDLHTAARGWIANHLQSNGLFTSDSSLINFLETREEKVACISEMCCEAFLDDLPEVLQDQAFPAQTLGILFDPSGSTSTPPGCIRITSWKKLSKVLTELG